MTMTMTTKTMMTIQKSCRRRRHTNLGCCVTFLLVSFLVSSTSSSAASFSAVVVPTTMDDGNTVPTTSRRHSGSTSQVIIHVSCLSLSHPSSHFLGWCLTHHTCLFASSFILFRNVLSLLVMDVWLLLGSTQNRAPRAWLERMDMNIETHCLDPPHRRENRRSMVTSTMPIPTCVGMMMFLLQFRNHSFY